MNIRAIGFYSFASLANTTRRVNPATASQHTGGQTSQRDRQQPAAPTPERRASFERHREFGAAREWAGVRLI